MEKGGDVNHWFVVDWLPVVSDHCWMAQLLEYESTVHCTVHWSAVVTW